MTMEELATTWEAWLNLYGATEESINDFCDIYASNYEEYMAIYEFLAEELEEA